MNDKKKTAGKPLPLVIDTMPGRKLRVSAIDRQIHSGTEGIRDPHPLSPAVEKSLKDLPY